MRKILKKTASVSLLTFFSRLLGLIRDALIAFVLGAGIVSDAFFIAFRPFDLARKLFSEGILSISFIPVFSRCLEQNDQNKMISMVYSSFLFVSAAGVFIILGGMCFAPFLMRIITPGFLQGSYEYALTLTLFKIMLPYALLISITGLCMGILNTMETFFAPAAAPVLFNLTIILATLICAPQFEKPVFAMAWGVTSGGVVQLIFQIPFLVKHNVFKLQKFNLFHPGVIEVMRKLIPSMIGASSYQINIMLASFFATSLHTGNVSFLYYADRLIQFPLGLVAISLSIVVLPHLSKKVEKGGANEISELFADSFRLVFFITIPAMAGLMALNEYIIVLLFQQGAFNASSVNHTADCLFYLLFGLWAFAGTRLFVTLNYAFSNVTVPFISGACAICFHIVCSLVLINPMGLKGLAISVCLSGTANFFLLIGLSRTNILFPQKALLVSACRAVFVSVIMAFLIRQTALVVLHTQMDKTELGIGIAGLVVLGIILYSGISMIVSRSEIRLIRNMLNKD
ncbi:MAG: murein biosynthesis integral membrane protein MurJ [Desulfobacteraceae bacterium]|nr:murein biosynthesis integral membrane protein MurJ [Desulfobacteraceae bacterium]